MDKVLEACFQLLSLFFMTIGRNNEAPAVYALTSTIRRLLDHLTESTLYSSKDLDHISSTLGNLRRIIGNAHSHSEKLVTIISQRLAICSEMCNGLQQELHRLDSNLAKTREKLISILRSISLANTKSKFNTNEVLRFQEQVKEIDVQRVDGHFVNEQGEHLAGDAETSELLRKILIWSDIVLERYVSTLASNLIE